MEVVFQYVAVAGLLQSLLLAVLLITKKQNHEANILLAVLIVVASFQALLNAFDTKSFFLQFPHLSRVSWLLPTLFGPLVYLYANKMTYVSNKIITKKDFLHFIPFLIYLIVLLPHFLLPIEKKLELINNFEKSSEADFGILTQLSIPLIFSYLFATYYKLHQNEKTLREWFSNIEKLRLKWLKHFTIIVINILILTAIAFYAAKYNIPGVSYLYNYTYFTVVLFIYWIGYKSLSQPEILHRSGIETKPQPTFQEVESIPKSEKYKKSSLTPAQKTIYINQLDDLMASEHPYLAPELSLQDLSERLSIPRHHLSQIINEEFDRNFFDYINTYRIKAFKEEMLKSENSHLTMLAIALSCGFNSKATFNAAFKKNTGVTPSTWLKTGKNKV